MIRPPNLSLILLAPLALLGSAQAVTVISSHGTVSGANDANQAGPIWAQSFTANIGADPGGLYGTLYLQNFAFQITSATTGKPALGSNVYLQLYDGFTTDGSGGISSIGNLIAFSSDRADLGGASNSTLNWNFAGEALDGGSTYVALFSADQTTAATLSDSSNLRTGAFELETKNPYTGGQAYRANAPGSGTTDWDLEFRATFDTVPEPSALSLLGLTGLGLLRRRR